jgi:hypothetical protein
MRLGQSHDPARGTKTPWDAQAVKAKDQMSALGPTRASASERGNGRYLRQADLGEVKLLFCFGSRLCENVGWVRILMD